MAFGYPCDDDSRMDWPDRQDGLQRSCHECGDPVLVSRHEAYVLHIFCPDCLAVMAAIRARAEARQHPQGA